MNDYSGKRGGGNLRLTDSITTGKFKKMMRKLPLKVLHEQLIEQVEDDDASKIPTRPSLKKFDAEKGGLDSVMDSEWFFS